LDKNSKIFESDKIEVINQDSLEYLSAKSKESFDFVFVDPPFNENIIPQTLQLLSKGKYIKFGSKIYVESEYEIIEHKVSVFFVEKIKLIKQKKSGQVHYCLIEIL
jgi:16S rRNA (guanine966-N2)-methyltransferase